MRLSENTNLETFAMSLSDAKRSGVTRSDAIAELTQRGSRPADAFIREVHGHLMDLGLDPADALAKARNIAHALLALRDAGLNEDPREIVRESLEMDRCAHALAVERIVGAWERNLGGDDAAE